MLKTVSTIMLLVTAGIYMVLRKLRDLQGSCILNFLICYIFVYVIVFDVLQFKHLTEPYKICPSIGYVFYFFSLSSFGWLSVSIFNAWKNLLGWNTHYMKTYIFYLILVYGGASVCLSTIVMLQYYGGDDVKPNFLHNHRNDCWFESDNQEWLWVVLPSEICLFVAAVFLVDSVRRVWRMCVSTEESSSEMKALFKNCWVSFKLYVVIAITWIMSFLSQKSSPGYMLQFFLAIQGILVFIVLIITEKKTMKALSDSEHYGCSLFPTKWTPVQNKGSSQTRYYAQNDDIGDVDLTLPSQRKPGAKRHASLGVGRSGSPEHSQDNGS